MHSRFMKLPFRYQFNLAPFTIVALLACLVAYTLFELSTISQNNEVNRQWEILTDRIQTAIASANRLNSVIAELSSSQDIQQDEHFFNFLEQTGILSDSLLDPVLLEQIPPELRLKIKDSEQLLREPERTDPTVISDSITALLPTLEYQYKIFAAQRRTAFIDNHKKLVIISSRMTTILLSGLILCIVLASGLAFWGLTVTRRRLKHLTHRAHAISVGDNLPLPAPATARDELDDLEMFLTNMTSRLLNVVSMENVLHGAENERRRIAMDMHDGVLADLTAINRRLDSLITNSITQNHIKSLRADVDDIINHLRCTIDDLHPQVLETLGLEAALQSYLDRHSMIAGFPNYHFEFDKSVEEFLPMDRKINLFRIITEAINNVIKHAHCDRFEVCLRIAPQQLLVTVEDNGVGMAENTKTSGHGCANIAERAHLVGATVQWRASRFTSGTCFELILPLKLVLNQGQKNDSD
jgi:signal transduction histidine kinase